MKAFSRAIDRFCYKNPNFGIPRLIVYVVGANILVTLLTLMGPLPILFSPGLIMEGQFWRIITWIAIPPTFGAGFGLFFFFIYLYFLYFMGSTLERELGTAKFTIYYTLGILFNIIYGLIVYFASDEAGRQIMDNTNWLTPTYLNLSMFFAFALIFPDFTLRLMLIIPVKAKWLALVNAGFFVFAMVGDIAAGRYLIALVPLVALLNFFIMFGSDLFARTKPSRARSPEVVNFKKATKQAKRKMEEMPYRHKCAVCGKTDVDHPDLEFRYCSQCEGYHCFCLEHINNHIHFT